MSDGCIRIENEVDPTASKSASETASSGNMPASSTGSPPPKSDGRNSVDAGQPAYINDQFPGGSTLHRTFANTETGNERESESPQLARVSANSAINARTQSPTNPEVPSRFRRSSNFHPGISQGASARRIVGWRWAIVLVAIYSSLLLNALDLTIISVISPSLAYQLRAISQLPWFSLAFSLAQSASVLPLSKVYSILPAKYLYIGHLLVYMSGVLVCMFAGNMPLMIFGRALSGLGSNGMSQGAMLYISKLTTPRERPSYIGYTGFIWGIGVTVGPIVGAAFQNYRELWGWRLAFFLQFTVCLMCLAVYFILLPKLDPLEGENESYSKRFKDFDYLGSVTIAGALVLATTAITLGGVKWAWVSYPSIAMFLFTATLFSAFIFIEKTSYCTTPSNRLLPITYILSRSKAVIFLCAAAGAPQAFIPINYIPLMLQLTRGANVMTGTAFMVPFIVMLVLSTLVSARMLSIPRFSYYKAWYVPGGILVFIGSICMTRLGATSPLAYTMAFPSLIGAGCGLHLQNSYTVIQSGIMPEEISLAIGFTRLAQLGGGTFGLAIAGAVFVNNALKALAPILPHLSREELELAVAGTTSEIFGRLHGERKQWVLEGITNAISATYYVLVAGAVVMIVASSLMTYERLWIIGPRDEEIQNPQRP